MRIQMTGSGIVSHSGIKSLDAEDLICVPSRCRRCPCPAASNFNLLVRCCQRGQDLIVGSNLHLAAAMMECTNSLGLHSTIGKINSFTQGIFYKVRSCPSHVIRARIFEVSVPRLELDSHALRRWPSLWVGSWADIM